MEIALSNFPEVASSNVMESAAAYPTSGVAAMSHLCWERTVTPSRLLIFLRVASMASGGEQAVGGLFVDFELSWTVSGPSRLDSVRTAPKSNEKPLTIS